MMLKISRYSITAALTLAMTSVAAVAEVESPVVPVSVVEKAANGKGGEFAAELDAKESVSASTQEKATSIVVQPGVNQILPVSLRHINRLVTPFAQPDIKTASVAETKIEGNVVYVVPSDDTPVTMFITEKGETGPSISLTLVPRKVPPMEVTLKFNKDIPMPHNFTKKAEDWEKAQPYVQTLVSLLRGTAKQMLPPGYNLGKPLKSDYMPSCEQEGLEFNFEDGQVLQGHNFHVSVGTVKNVTKYDLEFVETACADWVVTAVASFPNVVLRPGDTNEIYVVSRKPDPAEPRIRPSLVYGKTGDNK